MKPAVRPASDWHAGHAFTLRDGRSALVRSAQPSDALPLWEVNRAVTAAGVGVTRLPDELDKPESKIVEDFKEWTEGVHSGRGGNMAVALVEGVHAGSGVVRRHTPSRMRHWGHIGLGIAPEYQGLGLGRAVMLRLIDWAVSGPGKGVTRLDLNVFADNAKAIALYHSLGFVVEGERRAAIRYEDGRHVNDLCMALLLTEARSTVPEQFRSGL